MIFLLRMIIPRLETRCYTRTVMAMKCNCITGRMSLCLNQDVQYHSLHIVPSLHIVHDLTLSEGSRVRDRPLTSVSRHNAADGRSRAVKLINASQVHCVALLMRRPKGRLQQSNQMAVRLLAGIRCPSNETDKMSRE